MGYDWLKVFSINQFESVLRFSQFSMRIRIRISFGNWLLYSCFICWWYSWNLVLFRKLFSEFVFFKDQDQDHDQDQDCTMKFIGESYSSYARDIQQIWCRSAKFLWKSKFCSGSGSGSGSWYYFGFQYQTYISYIEDTHQILFGSANSFASYCVHMKSPRTYVHPDRQTDRRKFFSLLLSFNIYKTWIFIKRRNFFFSLMRLQYFLFLHTPYVMRKKKFTLT